MLGRVILQKVPFQDVLRILDWTGLICRDKYFLYSMKAICFFLFRQATTAWWHEHERNFGLFSLQLSDALWEQGELILDCYSYVLCQDLTLLQNSKWKEPMEDCLLIDERQSYANGHSAYLLSTWINGPSPKESASAEELRFNRNVN